MATSGTLRQAVNLSDFGPDLVMRAMRSSRTRSSRFPLTEDDILINGFLSCAPQEFMQPSLPSHIRGVIYAGQGELQLCRGSECDADVCVA